MVNDISATIESLEFQKQIPCFCALLLLTCARRDENTQAMNICNVLNFHMYFLHFNLRNANDNGILCEFVWRGCEDIVSIMANIQGIRQLCVRNPNRLLS